MSRLELRPHAKLNLPRSKREPARVGEGRSPKGRNSGRVRERVGFCCRHRADRVSRRVDSGHILMVRNVEGLAEELQVDPIGHSEALGESQVIRLIRTR
jgi:hypothetical protein